MTGGLLGLVGLVAVMLLFRLVGSAFKGDGAPEGAPESGSRWELLMADDPYPMRRL
jgi:hypothetical protein